MLKPVDFAADHHLESRWLPELHAPSSLACWAVAGYIVLFLIRPWEVLSPWMQAIRVERVYAIGMLVVVFLTGRGLSWTRQSVTVVLFALSVALSSVLAWRAEYAWPGLYQYATVVVTYFVILAACRQFADMYWLIVTYVLTMHAYLGKSLWEYFVHGRHEFAQDVHRLVGIETTYGEPNAVAMSAVLSLPLWYFLWRCRHDLDWHTRHDWQRIFALLLLTYPAVVIVAVGLTNSRAGMVGLVAFVVGLVWYARHQLRPLRAAALGLVLLAGLWLVAPSEQKDRLSTLWNPAAGPANAQASAGGRWRGFVAALRMVRDRPLTGVGVGNFAPYRVARVDGEALVAHNLPGQILGEMGAIGGACFLLMVMASWRNARRVRVWSDGGGRLEPFRQLAIALQLTMLLMLLFGLSLHNGLRYNWLWVAAFGALAWEFRQLAEGELDELPRLDDGAVHA